MKRKRKQDEEDVLIENIRTTSNSIKIKMISSTTSRSNQKIIQDSMSHEIFIVKTLIDSMGKNKMKTFQYITEEHSTLISKDILFNTKELKNLEMLDFFFEKKFVSKESLGYDKDLLIHFISMENMVVSEYLIKIKKFDLLFESELTGRTAFLEAVKHGNIEMVNMILNSSVELKEVLLNQKLYDGSTALMLAIETQNLELIRIMMENNVKEDPKNDGTTIPMRLVSNNLFELAKHFLNKGHDLFAKDGMGGDLLSIALDYKIFYQAGGKLFLEFLIENGFSPNHEMETSLWGGGKKLLTVFQKIQNQTDLAMNMIQKGAEYVKFQDVYFIQDCTKKIKQFGGEIQDPTEVIPYQNDPVKYLFLSVIHNRLDILKEILSQLDCTDLKDYNGNNILGLSLISYRMGIFEFIVKHLNFNSMMKQKNNEGLLPLHLALQRANYIAVRTFCEKSDSPLNIDHLCFEKTRIHRELFYFLRQWKWMKNSKTTDIYFHFQ